MPVDAGTMLLSAQMGWTYSRTNAGFEPAQQRGAIRFNLAANTDVYDHVFGYQYTVTPGQVHIVDVYSFYNFVGESVTATKILAVAISATASAPGGKLRFGPGPIPVSWFFEGTDSAITLTLGSLLQAGLLIQDGAPYTLSPSARHLRLSNPGDVTVSASIACLVGD